MLNLDLVLSSVPAGWREGIVAEPQYAPNPEYCEELRWYGFHVGVPLRIWKQFLLPHVQALLDEPVSLFGKTLRNYGWFARIAPITPIQSTDQLVWLNFYDPLYQDAWRAKHKLNSPNNLTCAPGVRQFLQL